MRGIETAQIHSITMTSKLYEFEAEESLLSQAHAAVTTDIPYPLPVAYTILVRAQFGLVYFVHYRISRTKK